jgi:hypothetical protein
MDKLSTNLSGVSGEYFVAAELSRRGFITSVTLKNAKGIDILITDENARLFIGIQVKTNQKKRKAWVLTEKSENFHGKNLFYVFVNLNILEQLPDFYIVPSIIVSNQIIDSHKNWLNTPGKKGQKHNDNPLRSFHDEDDLYLNKWELLKECHLDTVIT